MTPVDWFDLSVSDWQQLRALLDEALVLPQDARAAWLATLGERVDERLRQRLHTMLAERGERGALLSHLDAGPRLAATDETDPPVKGRRIGPYQVLRLLGRGGMGSVWLAERADGLHRRQVALKLPHALWHRPALADRMAREREILAALEHPNIARLYDAGVSDDNGGQPWLAIEFVDGVRIDDYCRTAGLSVPQRLLLFAQVCDAVAHAHARLVVHRDLKPANILIDRDGQVKLLDFGIAKLMEGDTAAGGDLTQLHGQAMTPDYAAPEQIRGESLSTAADVYALGVVLFELLTGERLWRRSGQELARSALERAVLERDPPKPSEWVQDRALARRLRGDLDTIVEVALRKRPADRYLTVAALAEDVRHHLADERLSVRPEGAWSRWRRFTRRHRSAVVAGLAAAMALLGGSGLALWQAREAAVQRDLAVAAQQRAQAETAAARAAERAAAAETDLSSFLLSDLSNRSAEHDLVRQLERATHMVRAQYRDDPSMLGRMLVNLALNYRWVSLHEPADRLFAEAGPLLERHGPPALLGHWKCLQAAGLARQGELIAARALLTQAYALIDTGGAGAAATRGECLLEDALVMRFAGEAARAALAAEQALVEFKKAGRGESEQASEALNVMARARGEAGDFAGAVVAARGSIALLERTGRDATPGFRNAWGLVARGLRDGGRPLDALPAHGANGRFDPADPELPTPVRLDFAETLIQLHRFDAADAVLVPSLAKARADGDDNQVRFITLARWQLQVMAGRAEAAQTRAEVERLFAPLRVQHRARVRRMLLIGAEHAVVQGRLADAESLLRELDTLQPSGAVQTPDVQQEAHRIWARLERTRGNANAARLHAERAVAHAKKSAISPVASLQVALAELERARALRALGKVDEGREAATRALEHVRSAGGADHPLVDMARGLAR